MVEMSLTPRKLGGSWHVIIPVDVARSEGLKEGVPVRVTIEPEGKPRALGLLRGKLPFKPFDRHEEGDWPDA
ncbi:MAG: AbrB/MazE/SpoVT family DNA-binding domain-containing protein [Thermoplasmatota archaeon]